MGIAPTAFFLPIWVRVRVGASVKARVRVRARVRVWARARVRVRVNLRGKRSMHWWPSGQRERECPTSQAPPEATSMAGG